LEACPLAGVLVDLGRSDLIHIRQRGVLRATRCLPRDRGHRIAVRTIYRRKHDRQPLSGFLPGGVLQLIAEQITLISHHGNETLGTTFVVGLLIALVSANSGMAALFDALNVVYDEREKRSLVRFYAITFLFTLAGTVFVIGAITGGVVLPLMLKFVGLATTTEWLLAILRWPILFLTLVASLACIYRYGPSRRDARWRWVTWGSIFGALLWIAASSLFSWYVATFDSYNATYGSLGAGVGFMVCDDRPARRRDQRGDGAPDRSRHDGRGLEASWLTRRDDGGPRRRGTSIGKDKAKNDDAGEGCERWREVIFRQVTNGPLFGQL
jgi:virulence factor BrkB